MAIKVLFLLTLDGIISIVSDSYDIFEACRKWKRLGKLRAALDGSGAFLVIRPDSGDPLTIIPSCLSILEEEFGVYVNEKNFKVLKGVRILQGDAINNPKDIDQILEKITSRSFSSENVLFGQGGSLLQKDIHRDRFGFVMKLSAIYRKDLGWIPVSKSPITDPTKKSKEGRVTTFKNKIKDEFVTKDVSILNLDLDLDSNLLLREVYRNGKLLIEEPFSVLRSRAWKDFEQ